MKFLIVQITDVHFRGDKPIDLSRSVAVGSAIGNAYSERPDHVIMIYSGDFVWSGKEDDYAKVSDHLTNIEMSIEKIFGKVGITRVTCPGNHDCYFSSNDAVRKLITDKAIESKEYSGDYYEAAMEAHANYFKFAGSFEPDFDNRLELWPSADNRLGWQKTVKVDSCEINFVCLNTAWLSEKHEDPGRIKFPDEDFINTESSNTISIGVMHHPLSWMSPVSAHRVRQSLLQRCDIVFSGHEHQALAISLKQEVESFEVKLFEGAAYSDHSVPNGDGFTTVLLDVDDAKLSSRNFTWESGGYVVKVGSKKYDAENDEDYNVAVTLKASNEGFPRFSKDYDAWLSDPGLPLFNSERPSLYLSEIFVFPETKSLRIQGAPSLTAPITSTASLLDLGYCVALGPTNAGKTSIAKELCRRAIASGLLPVYIDARKLKAHGSNFSSYIQKNIDEQYGDSAGAFEKRNNSIKILILDDFHAFASRKNIAKVESFLSHAKVRFGRLFIFGNDVEFGPADFASIFQGSPWGIPVGLQILPFSLKKRNELLWKWLNTNQQLSEEAANAQAVEINKKLDLIIGRNFAQPFPAYLLAVMQGVESGREIDLSTSTHGQFYEIFIKSCLAKKATSTNYNVFSNFLGMLAYKAFVEEVPALSDDFIAGVHREFEDTYDLSRPLEPLKKNLTEIGLLTYINGCYCFSEKFVVYYFTAYYIKDRLNDQNIRDSVKDMADKLWVDDYANVMLFLVHLSKDEFVVSEITSRINAMFKDSPEANLSEDVKFLASYGDDVDRVTQTGPLCSLA